MGLAGRQFCEKNGLTAETMGNKMIEMFTYLFNTEKDTRPKYTLHKVQSNKYEQTGIIA